MERAVVAFVADVGRMGKIASEPGTSSADIRPAQDRQTSRPLPTTLSREFTTMVSLFRKPPETRSAHPIPIHFLMATKMKMLPDGGATYQTVQTPITLFQDVYKSQPDQHEELKEMYGADVVERAMAVRTDD